MGDCLISFIVPVYNAADYISECVESILRQTVPDFEVLIVDDGSFDGSELICDEFAEKDQRVRVIHTENCGVSHARNTGIELAKGRYLVFVDADDMVSDRLAEKIEKELRLEKPVDMVCWLKSDFIKSEDFICERIKSDINKEVCNVQDMWERVVADEKIAGYVWNKVFLKSILDKQQIRFHEDIAVMEDLLFVCEYLKNCHPDGKVILLNDKLYGYRQLETSVSHIDFSDKKLTSLIARDLIIEILTEVGFSDYRIARYRNQLLRALCVMNKKLLGYKGENRAFWLCTIDRLWEKHRRQCRYDRTWQFKEIVYRLIFQVTSRIRKRGK